jgi:transposase
MTLMMVNNHNEQGKDHRSQPRWSAGKKTDVVLRLLRGEPLEELSRELQIEAHRLAAWRDDFLAAGKQGLKGQQSDRSPDDRALKQAERKIGQLTMENEVLRAAAEKRGLAILPAKRVGAENPPTSCDLGILVDQPAEPISPHDPYAGRRSGQGDGPQRCRLTERAMRPMFVVMRYIDLQCHLEMSSAHDQHPVQQFTTYRPDPSFGERVRARRPHRRTQDPDALGSEDDVEGGDEFRVPVANQELDLPGSVCQVHEQVAGLLGHPRPGRVGGHAEDVHPAGGKLQHQQHVQALEQHRVDVEAGRTPGSPGPGRTTTAARSAPHGVAPGRCRPG